MGPAEMVRVGIYRDGNMVAKLHLLQHEHTRQATTNRKWSELQAVPVCAENKNFTFSFFSK